ncbi:hypothetical protein F1880_002157 [Penicillium rolfsii]|nr:hypothetical protein F1880_002157 [Penicillium rolfsii]
MDNAVDLRESPSLDPSTKPHHDLGLTLSPGSQPQLAVPCSNDEEDVDDLASLFDIDDDFDPFTDFGKLAHQEDPEHGSKKRTSEAAFQGDIELSPSKKQSQEKQIPLAAETIMQLSDIHSTSRNSTRSIQSHLPFISSEVPASASSTIKNTFQLNPESLARVAAVEAFTQVKSSSKHISPYAPVGYYPSAPHLHCMIGGESDSNEALKSRLDSSRRRLNVVIAERNKYRDALLKYEQPDPETGMLGVQRLEVEVQRLRRLTSTHRYRMDQVKAEAQEWKDKYAALATTHNCLIRDYQTLQATMCHQLSIGEAPTEAPEAAFTSPPEIPQGSHGQSRQANNVMCAAYVQPPTQPSNTNSSALPPASPLSISSPTQTFRAATKTSKSATSSCEKSEQSGKPPGSDTCSLPAHSCLPPTAPSTVSPPTLESPTLAPSPLSPPTLTGDRPIEIPSIHLEDPPPNLPTPVSASSPPGEPTTMATDYANSIFSGPRGYVSPMSPEQAAILLQHAGIPFYLPAGNSVAAHQAMGSAMTATSPPAAAITTANTTNTTAAPFAPTVPPKDIVVIDLTGDSDTEEVSPQGSHTQSPTPLLTQHPSPLTEFRRRFREKKLTWLHDSNSRNADHQVADKLLATLNSKKRKRERDKKFVKATWDECYGNIQAKKHVRWVLGGPLSPLTGVSSSPPVVAEARADDPTDDEFARMLEESLARGKTPEDKGIAAKTTIPLPSGPSCLDVEAKGDIPEPYSIVDDE